MAGTEARRYRIMVAAGVPAGHSLLLIPHLNAHRYNPFLFKFFSNREKKIPLFSSPFN